MGNLIYNNTQINPPQHANMLGIIWFDNDFENIGVLGTDIVQNQKEAIYIATGGHMKKEYLHYRK